MAFTSTNLYIYSVLTYYWFFNDIMWFVSETNQTKSQFTLHAYLPLCFCQNLSDAVKSYDFLFFFFGLAPAGELSIPEDSSRITLFKWKSYKRNIWS